MPASSTDLVEPKTRPWAWRSGRGAGRSCSRGPTTGSTCSRSGRSGRGAAARWGAGEEHRVQVPARGAQAGGLETPPGGDPERARGELEHGDRPSDALVLEAEVRDHEAAAELGGRAGEGVGRLLSLHVERLTQGGGRLRAAPPQT